MTTSTGSIYRTRAAETAVRALYERTRARLPFATAELTLPTSIGPTHVLTAGPRDAPPLVLLQGGNVVNPITLAWLAPLAGSLRIIAPDTPGQPGLSHPHRPTDMAAFGRWLVDLLDGIGLERATVLGASQGAGVALRFAALAPDRIDRLILVVPSGIAATPLRAMLELTLAYARYRLRPRRATAEAVARRLTGGIDPDPDLVDAIGLSFGGTTLERDMPPLATPEELRGLTAPVLVLTGEHDPLFPPDRVLPRARVLFESLAAAEVLQGAAHILTPGSVERLGERLAVFLFGEAAPARR